MIIFIIGPGGAGKTTTGKILAKKMQYAFIDLDEMFMQKVDHIGKYIDDFGYKKYCFSNSELFEKILKKITNNTVFILSSGFLAHEGLNNLTKKHSKILKERGKSIMIMPSRLQDECVNIIVKRQLARGFGLKEEREREKINSRFLVYKKLGDIKIFSNNKPKNIAKKMKNQLHQNFGI